MQDACLVLIDLQRGFRDAAYWGERNNLDAETNVAGLLTHWRARSRTVVHIGHDSTEAASPFRPGQPGNEFEDYAMPAECEPIYRKCVNSAFIGTSFEADLRAQGITDLVVCGATTDHCVSTSVRMGANLGFHIILAGDACFTHERATPSGGRLSAEAMHEAHLASLDGEFARVVATADLLADS